MTYGGIYRDVYIDVKEAVYLENVFLHTDLQTLTAEITRNIDADNNICRISIGGNSLHEWTVLCKENLQKQKTYIKVSCPEVELWDVDHPNLYDIKIELLENENVIDEIQISTLYMMNEDDNKQVKSVIINTSQINKILGLVNKTMKNQMDKLREEKLTIPLTSIFGETLFSKIGPNLNLRIIPIGNFKCDVVSEVSEYGINNSLFEIYILIKINIDSIVPLNKINSDTNCKIPIVMQVIQGDVPRYYYNTDKIVPDVYDSNAN